MNKKIARTIASIIGIVLGIAIIIIGFGVQGISMDASKVPVGSYMRFGADFYTEMYDVTRDVGSAINNAQKNICVAVEGVCDAIGWLIVAVGLFDVAYFVYKMASGKETAAACNCSDTPAAVVSTDETQEQND